MGKLDFNKLIGYQIIMDNTSYLIEGRAGVHIGNINTVKLSTGEGNLKSYEYRLEATINYRLDNGQAQIIPPKSKSIKQGIK